MEPAANPAPPEDNVQLDHILQLKYLLLTGNKPFHFIQGVEFVKIVEEFTTDEKQYKSTKKEAFLTNSVNLRAKFYAELSVVCDLVKDSRHVEVIDCLKEAINKKGCCWQAVAASLVAVVRGDHITKESASAGFAVLPALLRHSTMLFFFLQLLKLASKKNKAGWGRGLKTAVRRWYGAFKPQELLLELWHRPKGYSWTHKDVMKMAHIGPNSLPLGTKVVMQYYFSNLNQTKVVFAKDKDAATYVDSLDMIYNKENSDRESRQLEALLALDSDGFYRLVKSQDPLLKHQEDLAKVVAKLDGFGVTQAVQDKSVLKVVAPRSTLPAPRFEHEEGSQEPVEPYRGVKPSPLVKMVTDALKDRLAEPNVAETVSAIIAGISMNNFNRRVKCCMESSPDNRFWRAGAAKRQEVSLLLAGGEPADKSPHFILPDHLDPVQQQLDGVIVAAAKRASIAPNHLKLAVAFDPSGAVRSFVNTELGKNVHKQIRGSQAVAISMLSLCYNEADGFGDRAFVIRNGGFPETVNLLTGDFRTITHTLEYDDVGELLHHSLTELIKAVMKQDKEEFVFFCHSITPDQLKETWSYLKTTPLQTGLKKVLLVGLFYEESTSLEVVTGNVDPRLLVINGFNFRSVDMIQAFLDDDY